MVGWLVFFCQRFCRCSFILTVYCRLSFGFQSITIKESYEAHLIATLSFCLLEECHLVNPFICSSSLEGRVCLCDTVVVRICQLHRFAVTVNQVKFI